MGARGTDCHRGAREETHINFRFYWAKVQVIYNQQAQNKVAAKGGGGGARNWEVDSCLTFSYILASLWCEGETNPACRRLKLWIEKEKQARERVCEEGERERKWLRMGGEGGREGGGGICGLKPSNICLWFIRWIITIVVIRETGGRGGGSVCEGGWGDSEALLS